MARISISLVSLLCVCQTLAAPMMLRRTDLNCFGPNSGVSSAQVNLAEINVLADVQSAGPLLTAQMALFNVSGLTAALAGFPSPAGAPSKVSATSTADIAAGVQSAQAALKDVKVLFNANGNKTTQNLAEVDNFLTKALASLKEDLTSCIAVAETAVITAFPSATFVTATPTLAPIRVTTVNGVLTTVQRDAATTGVPGATTTGIPGAGTTEIVAATSVGSALYGRDSAEFGGL
ncbi:hypothetical protein C8R46DRAFT_1198223 [Mycena filopes]|nr:hypothetical protein C8R46DRAFT_1198223 [Mycena filopes]